jgi:hypothetical protein
VQNGQNQWWLTIPKVKENPVLAAPQHPNVWLDSGDALRLQRRCDNPVKRAFQLLFITALLLNAPFCQCVISNFCEVVQRLSGQLVEGRQG